MVERNVARPDLVDLANRVKAVRDPGRERKGRDYARGASVEVRLKDGRVLSRTVDFFVGSHHRPMSESQIVAKFRKVASKTLPAEGVAQIEEIVWSLDKAPSMVQLTEILRGTKRSNASK
jgi:2-methylcitrate dehydratase PrpD